MYALSLVLRVCHELGLCTSSPAFIINARDITSARCKNTEAQNCTPSEKGETDDEDLFRLVVAIHRANNTSEFQVTT